MNDPNFKNVLKLAFGFQLLMGGFLTMAAIQKAILQSIYTEDPSFDSDGFICFAIIHVFWGLSNFIAPAIVAAVGPKMTLIVSSIFYDIYIASFLYPRAWLLYTTSVFIGIGAACLWVSNGVYFTQCCNEKTVNKNMGIYWTIQSSGMVIGLAFIFWRFQGVTHIDPQMRFWVITSLTAVASLGTATLCFLGKPVPMQKAENTKNIKQNNGSILSTLSACFRMLKNKNMLMLIPVSIYSGFDLAMFAGIYPTAVGFTEGFGSDAKKYVGLVGILIGLGNMTGGFVFGIVGSKLFKSLSRSIGVLFAGMAQCIALGLIYVNLSNAATFGPTQDLSYFSPPSVIIAMVCGYLLGIVDGCLRPQMCAAVSVIWPDDPSSAFALIRCFQGSTAGLIFYFSTMTGLYNLVYASLFMTILGTATFCWNEKLIKKLIAGKGKSTNEQKQNNTDVIPSVHPVYQISNDLSNKTQS